MLVEEANEHKLNFLEESAPYDWLVW